jgi:malonyl-CoA/methylmalonyl-CoA synthetase
MRFARALASSPPLAGVRRGERVGLAATPGAEYCAGAYATWSKGGVVVPVASSHSEDDAAYVMRHSGMRVVLIPPTSEGEVDVETREKYERAAKKFALDVECAHVPRLDCDVAESESNDEDADEDDDVDIDPSDGALIIYTSGTTGQPKGALHTHASLYAQCAGLIEAWRWRSSDRIIHALPLHHIHGIVNAWLCAHMCGATVEFQKQFAPRAVWARLRDSTQPPATVFMGVPTMYVMLLRALQGNLSAEARAASIDAASKLRLTVSGSAACPVPILEEWRKVTGRSLLERYGMTEIGMALSNPYDESKHKAGFVGLPLPGVDVKLAPLETSSGDQQDPGDDFALGPGELLVKGGNLFAEYFDDAEATAESFTPDGYFKTGDVAAMTSDGYWRILGRASVDVLKVGGFKVSALEIEARLLENQAIAEVAVLGIPDEAYGQRAVALVVLDRSTETGEPVNVTEDDIIHWARSRLAAKMHLRAVKFVDKMPRNAMGKVNKKDLQKTVFREYFVKH